MILEDLVACSLDQTDSLNLFTFSGAAREDYLAILTAYRPSESEWTRDFRKRKKS